MCDLLRVLGFTDVEIEAFFPESSYADEGDEPPYDVSSGRRPKNCSSFRTTRSRNVIHGPAAAGPPSRNLGPNGPPRRNLGPKVEIWDRRAALGEIWDIGLRAAPATGPQSAVLKTDTILGQLPTLENESDGRDRLFLERQNRRQN